MPKYHDQNRIPLDPAAARAEGLVADLTSHLIAITTGFTGASVVLFGATDGPGNVIVAVRGPERLENLTDQPNRPADRERPLPL